MAPVRKNLTISAGFRLEVEGSRPRFFIVSARLAVESALNCAVEHAESVLVVEQTGPASVWEGMVEVFAVSEPPPENVFTWVVMGKHGPEWLIVSQSETSPTPALAVRKWLKERQC